MDNKTINMNDDEVEIDLLQLFRALKKRILWIVGAGVIMGGAFGLFSKFAITPQYTSTSMVYILSNNTQHDTTKKRSRKSGSSCYFRGMRGYISISKSSGFRRLPGTAIFL